jgi:hypothetical protein
MIDFNMLDLLGEAHEPTTSSGLLKYINTAENKIAATPFGVLKTGPDDDEDKRQDRTRVAAAGNRFLQTYYAPGPGDKMEGPWATSRPNPLTGKSIPSTLDDVRLNKSPFVTLASDPKRYGQTIDIGDQTYRSPLDGKTYTLKDVKGYVHDTGPAFQGRPDKLDIAVGDFRGWNPTAASNFVSGGIGSDYAAANKTGRNMDDSGGIMGQLQSRLGGGGQQQRSGIDPEIMAYLAMIGKGLSPYSSLDPQAMLQGAQKQNQVAQQQAIAQRQQVIDNMFRQQQLGISQGGLDVHRGGLDVQRQHQQMLQDELERKARQDEADRKANEDALRQLYPNAAPSAPTAPTAPSATPGPRSEGETDALPQTASDAALEAYGAAGETGDAGAKSAQEARDAQLQTRIDQLNRTIPRSGLKPATIKALEHERDKLQEQIGLPLGFRGDPKEYRKAIGKKDFTTEERASGEATTQGFMMDEINRALDLLTGPPTTTLGKALEKLGIPHRAPSSASGLIGSWAQYVAPGGIAANLSAVLAPIESNVTMEAMQRLRDQSPTGSTGLGPISNFEDKLLGSLKGSLSQTQNEEQLTFNLRRLRNYIHAMSAGEKITPDNVKDILAGGSYRKEAIDALQRGAPREKIIKRLRELNIEPGGI